MEYNAHVFFAVFEFGQDACVVTQLAGFEPTEAWVVVQPMRKHPDVTHRHSRWTLKSPLPLSASVEEHLNALLSALEPNAEGIRAIQSRFPTHIGCAVYFQTHNPGFQLSATVTARVAALGLVLDFDLYFLGDCPTDDNAA
ncbi:MAG: hypothetical protein JWP08_1480 [Bryobacterales bacterium]|nr:hypothetical protein [Bryobacterales bacterium]